MLSTDILSAFKKLQVTDRRRLLEQLYRETESLSLKGNHVNYCPHCQSRLLSKYGLHNGDQRYKCSECNRTFKETTGTVLSRIHKKELFLKFQHTMLNGEYLSIKTMAIKFAISIPTAFDWRHKILLSLPESTCKFEGETEIDDIWIRYSQKGRKGLKYGKKRGGTSHKGDSTYQVKILTAKNSDHTEMRVTNIGRLSKSDIQRSMGDKLSKKTILISDKHSSIKGFATDNKIEHHSFKASEHTTKEGKGVQSLNNIAGRIDTLLNRIFRGVSTKYLQLYVNWFKVKENYKHNINDIDLTKEILQRKYTWDLFSNIEKVYENFIKKHSVRTYRCPQKEKYKTQKWNQEVINHYAFF